jgi:hypothetical protein
LKVYQNIEKVKLDLMDEQKKIFEQGKTILQIKIK